MFLTSRAFKQKKVRWIWWTIRLSMANWRRASLSMKGRKKVKKYQSLRGFFSKLQRTTLYNRIVMRKRTVSAFHWYKKLEWVFSYIILRSLTKCERGFQLSVKTTSRYPQCKFCAKMYALKHQPFHTGRRPSEHTSANYDKFCDGDQNDPNEEALIIDANKNMCWKAESGDTRPFICSSSGTK